MDEETRELYAVFGIKPRNGYKAMCIIVSFRNGSERVEDAESVAKEFLRFDNFERVDTVLTASNLQKAQEAYRGVVENAETGKLCFESTTLDPGLMAERRVVCYVRGYPKK